MTGQDAVRSAEVFHERVGITGVVLTKMDGDARGGAALSIKQVIGQPVKFVGVGEKYDAIEPFYPDRIAQRILGMGDVLTLDRRSPGQDRREGSPGAAAKMTRNQFTLEDFRSQLGQFKKLGSMSKLMKMLPGTDDRRHAALGRTIGRGRSADETHRGHHRFDDTDRNAIDHKILDASRKTRIANGSGSTIAEVNQLLRQYEQMRKMMAQMNSGGLFGGLGKKMMGGLAGGLGGMLGGGMNGMRRSWRYARQRYRSRRRRRRTDLASRSRKKKRHKKRK